MKTIIEFFVRYKVWTNVLMFSVLGFGLFSLTNLKYSFFPELPPDIILVQVVYPGASPEEVEEGIVLKIEENLDGLDGVERVTSVSRENTGTITVEILKGYEVDKVLNDVKNAVDRINSFPVGIEKPVIFEQKFRDRALSIVLFGETDLYNLKYIAENFRDELIATDEISQVAIEGIPDLEISIEISEENLRKYKLTFDEIANAVASANQNISGGKFETIDEEILIRIYAKDYFASEIKNIVIRGEDKGEIIYLKDVANIIEKWVDIPDRSYYNNKSAAVLNIDKTEEEDILAIAEKAKQMLEDFNVKNIGVEGLVLDDRTISLTQRLDLLISNGIVGLLLVIVTITFFLNLRMSFWVSVGIPFSFAGMFLIAGFLGITINVISLFGMIIVVGILVDDAIVVGENIYSHYEEGKPALKAAIDGATEMIGPVFTSVFTTIIAFLPFFFLDGFLGKFIWQMALVVIVSLLFSLVEAFLILPSHLAHSKGLHPHREDSNLRKKIDGFIHFVTYKLYSPSLKFSLKNKWVVLAIPISFLLVTIGLVRGGFIGVTFFPFIDGDTLPVNLSLVSGRQENVTDSLLNKIQDAALRVNKKLKENNNVDFDYITGIKKDLGKNDFGEQGSHTGRITLQLLDGEKRNLESYVIANMLREEVGPINEARNISFGRAGFFGKPISVSLLGNNLSELKKAQNLLFEELENFSTLKDVTLSSQEGRREINITLKPEAYSLGLSLRSVANQVRAGFFGQEIQRIQRGRDEIRVWVRYGEDDRISLSMLDDMRIKTADGSEYPFNQIAEYSVARGVESISRLYNQREIRIDADLANAEDEVPPILNEIKEDVVPRVLSQVTGIRAVFEGQSRSQDKVTSSMAKAFPIAMVGMFILIVLVFRSYLQAGIIFSLIPLGIVGAVWGHGIQGVQLNTLSIYGIIALTGIIVNDSIVLVDQFNRNLKNGQKVYDAVYNAGISRLRPILLTTITTAVGLAPIIAETSRQAQFLIPMAISVAYGLVFGTFILLVILPAGLLVLNNLRFYYGKIFNNEITKEQVEPAIIEIKDDF